ncbi:hypothetical protein [Cryptosporangium sp. NPDC051539]|uniref:hypothetical protein n=1 Tax=Cryptosporangium sp. NPDC051539 TaxID=3363962 RepID=UPI00379E6480
MTPPPLPTVRRRPASIVVAVLTLGLSVAWSLVNAVVGEAGRGGLNVFTIFLTFVLGVAVWQGTRIGSGVALALGVLLMLLGGLNLVAGSDDSNVGRIVGAAGLAIGALLVVMLLLPASLEYCWGEKPGY